MNILSNKDEILNLINNNEITVIYFSGIKCGACEVIKGKVKSILKKFPKIKSGEINGEDHVEIAAEFEVFSLPILLLYVEGKETVRVGRNIDMMDLERTIDRYYSLLLK